MSENLKKQHITQLKNNQTRIQRLFSFSQKIKENICDCVALFNLTVIKTFQRKKLRRKSNKHICAIIVIALYVTTIVYVQCLLKWLKLLRMSKIKVIEYYF